MMVKVTRSKTRATGGITAEEKARMDEHAALWIRRAFRTEPIEPEQIVPAIRGLYAAANLPPPRIVIVPSPLVMAFAYGAAAAIWYERKKWHAATRAATLAATDDATLDATFAATRAATLVATDDATLDATRAATDATTFAATRAATFAATFDATFAATRAATLVATDDATLDATRAATDAATYAATACLSLAGTFGLECARRWESVYQGGNMWAGYDCYLTACRDILGLDLPCHASYAHWEQAAIHGGFRAMHQEFCIVSDFPEIIAVDEQDRPHCETGPSHRWRDGWSLYHWHGTRVPAEWIESRASLTAQKALSQTNLELRRAACEIVGWQKILHDLDARLIDEDTDPQIGDLVEVQLPDLSVKSRFLQVRCGTGREFAICVPPDIRTALDAQAWIAGLDPSDFHRPEIRT